MDTWGEEGSHKDGGCFIVHTMISTFVLFIAEKNIPHEIDVGMPNVTCKIWL